MTKCIGCKCCVVACNEQNGNPAEINWRRVGEIEGGNYPHTQRHYLSMGCNHCLEPTCLTGCPVDAYTKDPVTGVVVTARTPASAASTAPGIARMACRSTTRSAAWWANATCATTGSRDGKAPACVAACPEGAIAIEIVNIAEWRARLSVSANAPGLPSADDSISTTRITLPENMPPDTGRVDTQRVASRTSALAAGRDAGADATLRRRVHALWLLACCGSGARSDGRGAGIACAWRDQSGRCRPCISGGRSMRGAR